MGEALGLLAECAPGFRADIDTFVQAIVLCDDASFRGASGISKKGLVFFSPESAWSVVTWAEELVHEATHNILDAVGARIPLVEGDDAFREMHPGPFRPDPRHHYGNYHGLVVVARLIVLFDLLIRKGYEVTTLEEKKADYIERSVESLKSLGVARLSALGRVVFEAIVTPVLGSTWQRLSP
jgi:HEXXH motif-containing protein